VFDATPSLTRDVAPAPAVDRRIACARHVFPATSALVHRFDCQGIGPSVS
jgi:hypothetical protein